MRYLYLFFSFSLLFGFLFFDFYYIKGHALDALTMLAMNNGIGLIFLLKWFKLTSFVAYNQQNIALSNDGNGIRCIYFSFYIYYIVFSFVLFLSLRFFFLLWLEVWKMWKKLFETHTLNLKFCYVLLDYWELFAGTIV